MSTHLPVITSHFVTSQDGLRLHVRDYRPASAAALPVLCLPGLTRNAEEFDVLARALSGEGEPNWRVLAMDCRGRGRSDFDTDAGNYTVAVEAGDVLAALADLERAIIIGSSRGGLIAMALAAMRPAVLAGVIFNDIGPVIELAGLLRIRSYAGRLLRPADMAEATTQQKQLFGDRFPALTEAEWRGLAERAWREENGKLVPTFDPAVSAGLMALTPETELPPAWDLFDALQNVPLMTIRGEHSDLLARNTVRDMTLRRPDMAAIEIPGQGHTPLLADAFAIGATRSFLTRCLAIAA